MRYFGTDGVRGIFGAEITPELCRALSRIMVQEKCKKVVVGCDTRFGGRFIADIITDELKKADIAVADLGIRTTAELSFLTVAAAADYGIMITASHNDYRYNGIKILNSSGEKLSIDKMNEFDDKLAEALASPAKKAENMGWCEHLYAKFETLKNWAEPPHIIIDAGNGAGAKNAEWVLSRLHLPFEIINGAPNGFNINKKCGALYPQDLSRAVKKHRGGCLGFAFDGDADRCVAVTKSGVMHGDRLIALLGMNEKQIVATKIFNTGAEKSLNAQVIKTDVGDRFVYDAMNENGINFGGETSGHIIDKRIWHSGDGLATALMLLARIKQDPNLLKTKIKIMPTVSCNLAISPADRPKFEDMTFGDGIIVRLSGTEGLLRITVTAKTRLRAEKQMKRTISFAKSLMAD
jgi:phosphoglucosamine mutase